MDIQNSIFVTIAVGYYGVTAADTTNSQHYWEHRIQIAKDRFPEIDLL